MDSLKLTNYGGPDAESRLNHLFCVRDYPERFFNEEKLKEISSAGRAVFFNGHPAVEFFRKIGVRLGLTADFTDIDYFRIVKKQQALMKKARSVLGITSAGAPCRFLLRVDDFPSPYGRSDSFLKFH